MSNNKGNDKPKRTNLVAIIGTLAAIVTILGFFGVTQFTQLIGGTLTPTVQDQVWADSIDADRIIAQIRNATSVEEVARLSPFEEQTEFSTGESGTHGPSGFESSPDCYGFAWNVIIENQRFQDKVVVIQKEAGIEMIKDKGGFYVTMCHEDSRRFHPSDAARIQAAIMDYSYPISDKIWGYEVLD